LADKEKDWRAWQESGRRRYPLVALVRQDEVATGRECVVCTPHFPLSCTKPTTSYARGRLSSSRSETGRIRTFTSHRILIKDGKGVGSKRNNYQTIPYKHIQAFACEMAGKLMAMWTLMSGREKCRRVCNP
jgi:hypothetical protein